MFDSDLPVFSYEYVIDGHSSSGKNEHESLPYDRQNINC